MDDKDNNQQNDESLTHKIGGVLGNVGGKIGDVLGQGAEKVGEVVGQGAEKVGEVVGHGAEKVGGVVSDVTGRGADKADDEKAPAAEKTPERVAPAGSRESEEATSVVDRVKEAAAPVVDRVKETVAPAADRVKEAAASGADRVRETVAPAAKSAGEAGGSVADRVRETVAPAAEKVGAAIAPVADKAGDAVSDAVSNVRGGNSNGNGKTPVFESGHGAPLTRLHDKYVKEVIPAMQREYGYRNIMQVPKLEKVVINIGMGGEARENAKALDNAVNDIGIITGQKAVITKAKKSIASFKLRTGMPIGVMVTLRGPKMYNFLDKLFNVSLARVRDFSGVSPKSFDGRGNFSLGLREQLIFPEIDYDKVDKIRGMEIVIVTSAKNDEEGRRLLELLGMPFRR